MMDGSLRSANYPRAIVLSILLAMVLVVTMAAGAFAVTFGGESGDKGQPPPGQTNPGNPPPSGGGGSTQPPTYKYLSSVSTAAGIDYTYGCAATNNSGGNWVGVRWRYRYPASLSLGEVYAAIQGGNDAMASAGVTQLNKVCLYDGSWRDETLKCVLSSTAIVKMIAPRHEVLGTRTTQSAYGAGDRSIAACKASRTQARVETQLTRLGHYRVDAHSRAVNMIVRTPTSANQLTGQWEQPRILSVSGEYTTNPMRRDGFLTCAGFREGTPDRAYSWNADDCDTSVNPPNVEFQCVDMGTDVHVSHPEMTNKRGERLTEVEMLGNGQTWVATWNTPRIVSPTGNLVSVNSARTRMLKEGDWLQGKQWTQQNAELRPAGTNRTAVRTEDGTGWMAGLLTKFEVNLYGAQVQQWQPQYIFDVTARVNNVRIDGLDEAGNFILTPTTTTVDTVKSCRGVQLRSEALRVVNF